MKIATLSFEIKGDKMALSASRRIEIILNTLDSIHPELLVTSGYSLRDNEDLQYLQDELKKRGNKTWVLIEVEKEELIMKNEHPLKNKYPHLDINTGTHNLYVINNNNEILNLGPQYFAQSSEVTGKKNEYRISEFEKIIQNRVFNINDKKVLVLCCGEINSIQGRNNITYISDKVKTTIESSDLILNPTHDCMANYGTLTAKRKFLSFRGSEKKTWYINSSNWNSQKIIKDGKIIKQNPKSNSYMQNLFFNGEKIEMKREILSEEYLLHVSNLKF